MNRRPINLREAWPWMLLIAIVAFGPLLGACSAPGASATPTPTKTPRGPEATVTAEPAKGVPPLALDTPVGASSGTTSTAVPAATPVTAATANPAATPAAGATPAAAAGPKPGGGGSGMTSPDFGIQAFLWWRPEVADRDLGLLKDAGFHWVKQLFNWQDIEGAGQGQYNWDNADRVVEQVQKYNLKLLARVSADPDKPFWAGVPPASSDAFARYAGAVAKRYAGKIAAYQIWNEPNLAREWGNKRPDPVAYAKMLKAAYAAIKAADPQAIIITAGMAPTSEDSDRAMPDMRFYQGMYNAMGGSSQGYFDMLGAHAAGYAVSPDTDPQVVVNDPKLHNNDPSAPDLLRVYAFRHVEDVRALMVKNGDTNKRLAILEFGWTFDNRADSPYYWHGAGAGITDFVQGTYIVQAFQYAAAHYQPWIGVMTAIYMPDVQWTKNDEQYYWSIIGPGYPDNFWRPPYIDLCIYINGLNGQKCKYDPNH
ncbi:MAG TPA: hypothetical protein VGA61_09030 [Anaerolineae bacterium]